MRHAEGRATRHPGRVRPAPAVVHVERDGLRIRALDWGGRRPLLMLHPNGFCAGIFEPLAQRLTPEYRPIAVDLRGHGGTDAPAHPRDLAFSAMADDVIAVLDALDVDAALAVGESLGGGVAALVDRARPGLITRVLLCEAVAFPAAATEPVVSAISEGARRRREVWPSRDAMRRRYRSTAPLSELAPDALDAYLRWGTVETGDGSVRLRCPPEIEAAIFELSPTPIGAGAAWDHLPSLGADAVVAAGTRSFLPRDLFAAQAEAVHRDLVVVDAGHFLLQEDSDWAAGFVRRHLPAG